MALSQLPLAKRKTLVKIFGNLKKNYKSLQKFSRTDGFQLMRRIVEYPLKESNVNQSFNDTFNSSKFFKKEIKDLHTYTSFYKINGKTLEKKDKKNSSKVLNRKIKHKYSRFFTKTINNQNLLPLTPLSIQTSNINTNPPFFSLTNNGSPILLPFFFTGTECKNFLQMQLTRNWEKNHIKNVGFITKKELHFNCTIPMRPTRKTCEIETDKIHNNKIIHKIKRFYGNKSKDSKIYTKSFLVFLHNYKHPAFKHPVLPRRYFPWKLKADTAKQKEYASPYHQRWYVMYKESQENPKRLTIFASPLHTVSAKQDGTLPSLMLLGSKTGNSVTQSSMWYIHKGMSKTLPALKLRKHLENKSSKATATTPVLTNRKLFTYFNNSIYLYWFVGHQQNEYESLFWSEINQDFSTFILLSQYYWKNDTKDGMYDHLNFTSTRGLLPIQGGKNVGIPPGLERKDRRWSKDAIPSKEFSVRPSGAIHTTPRMLLTGCASQPLLRNPKVVWGKKQNDGIQREGAPVPPMVIPSFCFAPVIPEGERSICGKEMQYVGNRGKESVFQESRIPFLSESDQVTFVADSRRGLNQRTLLAHQFTPYVGTISAKQDNLQSWVGCQKSFWHVSLNKMIKPSYLFWGIPFFVKNNHNALSHTISTLLLLKGEQAKSMPYPSSNTYYIFPKKISIGAQVGSSRFPANKEDGISTRSTTIFDDKKGMKSIRKVIPGSMCNTFTIFPGQLLTYGDTIANDMVTTESGQVLYVDSHKTIIRKAQTVLIYSQAIIAVLSGEWIKKGTPLMSLSYQKLVTGDIVQGLPKIEQFFEAPVLKDGTFWSDSLQAKLNQFFQEEREQFPLAEAVRKGFSEIQRVLVEGVQRVYISQGVLIADKHLEVIVRQMTCKGRILYSGDTGFLRNELVSLDKIESVNQVTYGQKALYHPQVRGITDASLESESFLSAASFQETTRVLSRDAIIGKTDLMRGLKERVIVGELIQAGTGLANNSVYNLL